MVWDCGVIANRSGFGWMDLILCVGAGGGAEEKLPSDDEIQYLQTLNASHMISCNPSFSDCFERNQIRSKKMQT